MAEGWIKLHRKLMESEKYFGEIFCRNAAWIDLLMLANISETITRHRGISVKVTRGQCAKSLTTLAKRWRWSTNKVKRFLNELENDKQIELQKNNITTLITITKYEEYQQNGTQTDSQTARRRHADGTQTARRRHADPSINTEKQQVATPKNVKNVKEVVECNDDPLFEMFRRSTGSQITDEMIIQEMGKFRNKYPNLHINQCGPVVNAWVGNIGKEEKQTRKGNFSWI